jgi:hypothetical protein
MEKPVRVDHPILDVRRRRWSPRAFAERAVAPARLTRLFEAFEPRTGFALGDSGGAEQLPASFQEAERAERTRLVPADFVFGASWGRAWRSPKAG